MTESIQPYSAGQADIIPGISHHQQRYDWSESTDMDQHNRTSSVYSNSPSRKPLHLETRTNGSGSRPSSRATSYTPSYMSNLATRAPNGQPARSSPIPITQTTPRAVPETPATPAPQPVGALIIFSPGKLHPSLLFYLEILLEKHAFSSVVFAGSKTQEAELKQLRMNVFGLLGKMKREVAVSTDTRDTWTKSEIEATVQSAVKAGKCLQGVLCCPELAETEDPEYDILEMEESQLESAWQRSTGFLHTVSRATLPHLLSNIKPTASTNGNSVRSPSEPFFLVTQASASSAASQIAKASFSLLMMKLVNATKPKGLTFGYAEVALVAEPKPASPKLQDEPDLQPTQYAAAEDNSFTPSESPTKLWNMWALQNDTPTFD